jgi:6,7-dimethyl-8-ribityllumazine synthase
VPVVFGVLTTDTVEQTMARADVDRGDKGVDCADAAAEMVRHLAAIRAD